jgi:hypothetical protein
LFGLDCSTEAGGAIGQGDFWQQIDPDASYNIEVRECRCHPLLSCSITGAHGRKSPISKTLTHNGNMMKLMFVLFIRQGCVMVDGLISRKLL